MEIYPCDCSWQIPGVESLPNHTHHYLTTWYNPTLNEEKTISCHPNVGRPGDPWWICMEIKESVSIWIDYEALSRAYADVMANEARSEPLSERFGLFQSVLRRIKSA
jgi:hypothetical protein